MRTPVHAAGITVILSFSLGLPPAALALRPRAAGTEEPTFVTAQLQAALSGAEERWDQHPDVQRILLSHPDSARDPARWVLRLAQILSRQAKLPEEDRQVLRIVAAFRGLAAPPLSGTQAGFAAAMLKPGMPTLKGQEFLRAERIRQILGAAVEVESSMQGTVAPALPHMILFLDKKVSRGVLSPSALDLTLQLLSRQDKEFLELFRESRGPWTYADQGFLDSREVKGHGQSDSHGALQAVEAARHFVALLGKVHIRWKIRRDMPEVLQVEQASFESPWTEEDFLRALRQRNCIGMVAEQGEKVVGFTIYELHKSKLHILNFAVHPKWRRQGVGGAMVAKLISKLSSHRRTRITLEVRETNLSALQFFRHTGFRAVGTLRGYYEDSGEDGVLMEYRFGGASEKEEAAESQEGSEGSPAVSDPGGLQEAPSEEPEEPALHSSRGLEKAPAGQLAKPEPALEDQPDIIGDNPGSAPGTVLSWVVDAMSPEETEAAVAILERLERRGMYSGWNKKKFDLALATEGISTVAVRDPAARNALAGFAVIKGQGARRTLLSFGINPDDLGKGVGRLILDTLKRSYLPGPA